jgi:hypothetical protein
MIYQIARTLYALHGHIALDALADYRDGTFIDVPLGNNKLLHPCIDMLSSTFHPAIATVDN